MRCFLVGNGPSLDPEWLDSIVGNPSFATNAIGTIYARTRWRPTHYVLATNGYEYDDRKDDYDLSICEAGFVFASEAYRGKIARAQYLRMVDYPDTAEFDVKWWSDTPDEWASKYGTSLLVCAQIASEMYDEIVFVGCDGYSAGNTIQHFDGYPAWGDDFDTHLFGASLTGAHKLMAHHLRRKGVAVSFEGNSPFADYYV